ncbi:MAG: ferritin-like domain-containing protein [Bacteroidetes bacterium]|nr:ferritin-like domain-containing protein [Bacteroidota bacterium]
MSTHASGSPTFDFTANGHFNPFSVYAEFLHCQAFEDTGFVLIKVKPFNSNNDVLTAALQIHYLKARHASYSQIENKMD